MAKAGQKKADDPGTMRSVRRCFQMLEYFDQHRRPMSPTELSKALDAPLSSMIDLLKCLGSIGYILYDSRSRNYYPTLRLGLLGEWLASNPLYHASYHEMMEDLRETTQETVSVFWQNDTEMKCVASMQGPRSIAFVMEPGESMPMFGSAAGTALIAKWNDADIKKAYKRHVRRHSNEEVISLDQCMQAVQEARTLNYAVGYNMVIPDVGAITSACRVDDDRWMVFSVAGVSKRIKEREREIAATLLSSLNANSLDQLL